MRRFYLLILFLTATSYCFSQADAGPDRLICAGSSLEIGNMPNDPTKCYSWKANPADPAVANAKTPKVTVTPTQTTTYTLTVVGQDFSSVSTDDVVITVQANASTGITWPASDYSSNNTNAASTTVEKPFVVEYSACADIANNVWRLRVKKITGGVTIVVRTGGSRNPITSPPVDEPEADDAVTVMKGYYTRGSRGSWHTEAASKAHEEHHYTEWKCSAEHYWADVENCLEQFTVPFNAHANEASAVTALVALGANAKINAFTNAAKQYWFTLGDGPSDRPYAAGQLALNAAITFVQNLAATNGWVVPQGTDNPSPANPCYQPYTALVIAPCP
jgi:hypothetical protein